MTENPPLRQRLGSGLAALGIDLDEIAIGRLVAYLDLLQRWNAAYNLTAVRDPREMVTRHLLDSLAVLKHVEGASLADLGSGAGLPGIPLAIAAPDRDVLLVDSNGKKARFLREAVRRLGLARVRIAQSRVEVTQGSFETITARAFTSLGAMLDAGGHLLAPDGTWLALKGRFPQDEIETVPPAFRIERIIALRVPGLDAERHLVVIKRARPTTDRADEGDSERP